MNLSGPDTARARQISKSEGTTESGSLVDNIVREGARRMLAAALEGEVNQHIAELAGERDEDGRRLAVRNGHHRERTVTTAAGPVAVKALRVIDKRVDSGTGERKRFWSKILKSKEPAMQYIRHAKGVLTVTTATAACYTLMSVGYTWARESAAAAGDTIFSGAFEFLLTTAASWALMPLLLWAGMRMLRETGNTVLVLIGGLGWAGVSGYYIDDIDRAGGHMPVLVLAAYVLCGAVLSGVNPGRASDFGS